MASDVLAELRGLHGPPVDWGAVLADALVALAIGLLAAWLIARIFGMVTERRLSPERRALRRLEEARESGLTARALILQDLARSLPPGEGDWLSRLDAHLGGLFTTGPGAGLREALYRPGTTLDTERFDAALKAALERAER